MDTRRTVNQIGFALCIVATVVCTVLHVATFLTIIPPIWGLLPFFLVFGAVICIKAIESKSPFTLPRGRSALLSCALLLYAVFTFVCVYRMTGGATSVGIVDGQYVYCYKSHVIRTITQYEYGMFPNLVTRVMSSWIGMGAASCISTFH